MEKKKKMEEGSVLDEKRLTTLTTKFKMRTSNPDLNKPTMQALRNREILSIYSTGYVIPRLTVDFFWI